MIKSNLSYIALLDSERSNILDLWNIFQKLWFCVEITIDVYKARNEIFQADIFLRVTGNYARLPYTCVK